MAVRLRLRRTGTKNKACYRVVATDQRSPRDGKFIEVLGYYDPRHRDEQLDIARVDYWLGNGAQPSATVASIIERIRAGTKTREPVPRAPVAPAAPEAPAAPATGGDAPEVAEAEVAVAEAATAEAE